MKLGINTNGPSSLKLGFMQAVPDERLLEISGLATWPTERGNGHATALLKEVCEQADSDKVLLVLSPEAFDKGGPDTARLEKWYEGFGFKRIQDKPVLMCRDPQEAGSVSEH